MMYALIGFFVVFVLFGLFCDVLLPSFACLFVFVCLMACLLVCLLV